ncbi:MAG: 16S rRNA pseudouridine(516) synthase [Pseudomonadota bacterium]
MKKTTTHDSFERLLHSQGLGSRKQCRLLIQAERVAVNGKIVSDPTMQLAKENLIFTVDDTEWIYREKLYLVMHKPEHFECSHSPQCHESIFSLLPSPFIIRGIQCVGRLDHDTTGLLLLTDDGAWLHALMSPRKHVSKTYRVTTKHPIIPEMLEQLMSGVILHDAPHPIKAVACEYIEAHALDLTIAEGKYHQVKRMVAAAGNRVEHLHRIKIADFALPEDVLKGEWRELTQAEKNSLA